MFSLSKMFVLLRCIVLSTLLATTLYGKPGAGSGVRRTTWPQEPPKARDPCAFDTLFNSTEGVTYAFKGLFYWKVGVGHRHLISNSWIGLPGNLDAAFTYKNGKTYFFKGSKYWRYTGKVMDVDYPKEISDDFPGIPDNVDAAAVWEGDGKIYFFKGSKYWRYADKGIDGDYPKEISEGFPGISDNLDAATGLAGTIYFFKGRTIQFKKPPQSLKMKSISSKPISNWKGMPDHINTAWRSSEDYSDVFKDVNYWRFNDLSRDKSAGLSAAEQEP